MPVCVCGCLHVRVRAGASGWGRRAHLAIAGTVKDVAWLSRVEAVGTLGVGRDVPLVALGKGSYKFTLGRGGDGRGGEGTGGEGREGMDERGQEGKGGWR